MQRSSREMTQSQQRRRARIEAVLDRFSTLRVLVIGDLLLDEYRSGDVDRISPEAPVPIVRVRSERCELGGAGNVARGIVALGAACDLVSVAGLDPEGHRALDLLEEIGVSPGDIVRTPDRATPHKLRIVARGQQMMRLDREQSDSLRPEHGVALREGVSRLMPGSDVVILQDYDKGLFADGLGAWSLELAQELGVSVVADPKREPRRFRGASLVKPNLEEACAFVPGVTDDFDGRRALLEKFQRELGGGDVVMTRGSSGMTVLAAGGDATDVPTRSTEVFDVQGAGDTSIAVLGLCRAAGAALVDACIVANAAGAVAVGKVGTAAVDLEEVRRQLPEAIAAVEGET